MTKKNEIGPGKEVLSYCGKCKLPLAHTIVAMKKNGTIGKCECKTCGANHLYRDPDKPVKARAGTKKKATISNEALWQEAVSNAAGPAKPYAMNATFAMGDVIDHSTFGKGVVEELISDNKLKVIFESNQKILIHNR